MSIKVTDEALARITVPIQEVKVYDPKDVTVSFQGIEIKGQNACREVVIGSSADLDPDSVRHWPILLSKETYDDIQRGFSEDSDNPRKIDDVAMLDAINAELKRQGLLILRGPDVIKDRDYWIDEMCQGLEDLVEVAPIIVKAPTNPEDVARLKEALAEIRRTPAMLIVDDPHSDQEPLSSENQLKATAAWKAAVGMSHPESVARFKEREILFFNKQFQTAPVFGGINNMQYTDPVHWDHAVKNDDFDASLEYFQREIMKITAMPDTATGIQLNALMSLTGPSYMCRSHGCPERAPSSSQCRCYTCGKMMEKL